MKEKNKRFFLLFTILIISVAGLAYELVTGTMATYLIGQSIHQFSYAMGWFLASMGIGSYYSRYIKENLFENLIKLQVFLSLVGGFSAAIMFFFFAYTDTLYPVFILLAFAIGSCVGLEIPILLRLIGKYRILSLAASEVFTYDYIGALLASILFPLFLLPYLGILRTSIMFGGMNLIAAWILLGFTVKNKRRYIASILFAALLLLLGFIGSEKLTRFLEDTLYQDPIVLSTTTKYQRIVLTKWKDDIRLFLDGNLQFSTRDEARYHESLIHIPISFMKQPPSKVLILGGGDGMAIREVLKYQDVQKITLVELDLDMIKLFKKHNVLKKLNGDSLNHPKVDVVIEDAFIWMKQNHTKYDLIIADLPDPNNYSLGKLYSVTFYIYLLNNLNAEGFFVTQSTSPTFSTESFWCIYTTIDFALQKKKDHSHWKLLPYHVYIPSFGDWGFVLLGKDLGNIQPLKLPEEKMKYLSNDFTSSLFQFSKDIKQKQNQVINHLDSQALVNLYEKSAHSWYR